MEFPVWYGLENILLQIVGYPVLLSHITLKRVIGKYVWMRMCLFSHYPKWRISFSHLSQYERSFWVYCRKTCFLCTWYHVFSFHWQMESQFPLTSYNCPDILIHTRITYPNLQQWLRKCNWRLITEVIWIFLVYRSKISSYDVLFSLKFQLVSGWDAVNSYCTVINTI